MRFISALAGIAAANAAHFSGTTVTTASIGLNSKGSAIECSRGDSGATYDWGSVSKFTAHPSVNLVFSNNEKWTHQTNSTWNYAVDFDVEQLSDTSQAKSPSNLGVGGNPHFHVVVVPGACPASFDSCDNMVPDKADNSMSSAYLGRCNGMAKNVDLTVDIPVSIEGDLTSVVDTCTNNPGPTISFEGGFSGVAACAVIVASNNEKWTHCLTGDSVVGTLDFSVDDGSFGKGPFMAETNGGAGGNPHIWVDFSETPSSSDDAHYVCRCNKCDDSGIEVASVSTVSVSGDSNTNAIFGVAGVFAGVVVLGLMRKRTSAVPATKEEKSQLVV